MRCAVCTESRHAGGHSCRQQRSISSTEFRLFQLCEELAFRDNSVTFLRTRELSTCTELCAHRADWKSDYWKIRGDVDLAERVRWNWLRRKHVCIRISHLRTLVWYEVSSVWDEPAQKRNLDVLVLFFRLVLHCRAGGSITVAKGLSLSAV